MSTIENINSKDKTQPVAGGLSSAILSNIGLASTIIAALSIATFIFGYLFWFDPELVVILDYSDLIKLIVTEIFIAGPMLLNLSVLFYADSLWATAITTGLAIIIFTVCYLQLWQSYWTIISVYLIGAVCAWIGARAVLWTANRGGNAIYIGLIVPIILMFIYGLLFGFYWDRTGRIHSLLVKGESINANILTIINGVSSEYAVSRKIDAKFVLLTTHHIVVKLSTCPQKGCILVFPVEQVREIMVP
jgi:hypothetical protein